MKKLDFFTKDNFKQLQPHYDHFFPLVRFYWHNVMKGIGTMIETPFEETILDFGCGSEKRLKKYLPQQNVIGYDIIRKFSDVYDYGLFNPHTIVCSHVLEHLHIEELTVVLDNFINSGAKFIITAQPTENLFSRLCNLVGRPQCLGKGLRPKDHILTIEQIHKALSSLFELKARKDVLTLTIISKWAIT
jgi:hypothetical protein